MSQPHFTFVLSTEKKGNCLIKLFNSGICHFHYLKSILNDDSFKEYIKPMVSINSKIYVIIKSLFLQLVAMNIYQRQPLRGAPWNQQKSENIETLYHLSELKEPVHIDYKEACSLWNKHINILLTYLLKKSLTHFMALTSFYSPWNTSEKQRFPDVFRGHRRRPVPWNWLRLI